MKLIRVFISRLKRSGEPGRGPFQRVELVAHGLRHPSDLQVRDVLSQAPGYLWPSVLFLAIFLEWDIDGFLILAIAWTVRYLSPLCSALMEHRNFYRWNRPDVFIGWNYSAIEDDTTLPAPPLGGRLIECMKPVWGAVLVIPPANPRSLAAFMQQATGNRGVFLPCLLVEGTSWKPAVTWVLGQVRIAVFEISEEGKPSLDWEMDEAIRLLGPDCVLLVKRGPEGCAVSTAAGLHLARPAAIDDTDFDIPKGSDAEAISTILGWCAEHLYVPPRVFNSTWRWYRMYGLEAVAIGFARLFVQVSMATGITLILVAAWQALRGS